ncbi:unnamed protein product [Prorocentrum cordatum]|uniref:Tyrosine specific protein phosphatases domain-containing protein n=1 Tax=Prorocentrum cordatum TaxID=2364126 RepID=A0ABN9W1G1_9DINO|nr:unnamed protein product [Polarella glacialis]
MRHVTLIPHRLSYGPVGSAANDQARLAFVDITAPEFRNGSYEVCHYHRSSYGGCFGPLAVDQTLWFCHELHVRLQKEGPPVAVEYEPEGRQNVAVVVGAYAVLVLGWSAKEVCGALPEDAGLTLPCSWIDPADLRSNHGDPRMTVQDCWEGVEIARDLGWLRKGMVVDGVMASLVASKFWKTTCEYDGAWLVPGAIFVMADPVTTIADPNPKTCPSFCRVESDADSPSTPLDLEGLRRSSEHTPTPLQSCLEARASTATGTRDSGNFEDGDLIATPNSRASVHTVCKVYGSGNKSSMGCDLWPRARPFVDFVLDEGIKTVLRVNLSSEPGLVEIGGSYDAGLLAEFGIQHADVPVSDSKSTLKGGVPPSSAIRRFLSLSRQTAPEDGGAVLVHCKGGFGRSVFLACLLVIYRCDVSGRGLLGWARIARPGAITTPEQEAVLRSLSGRADLCRKFGVPRVGLGVEPRGCCAVS